MTELIFLVEEAPEGGYTARALGTSIYHDSSPRGALRLGTLSGILADVANHAGLSRDDVAERLFG